MKEEFEALLILTRLGIGHSVSYIPSTINWEQVQKQANEHGLSAIVLDGIDIIPPQTRPKQVLLLNWIGEVLQNYEQRYDLYCRAISELANWYNGHGFKMMVLKGYSCSINWIKPEYRPCGDIDIWLFGQQKSADAVLKREKEIKIDSSHHHHTVYKWKGFTVENHYDFINVYRNNTNHEQEVLFKQLGKDDSHFVELYGSKVYMPSSNLHAFFLLRHMMGHFATSEITLRQILDWAFFIEKHTEEIDWDWLAELLDNYQMNDFYNCINAICVEDLGFPVILFPKVQFAPIIKERVLNDILCPKYSSRDEPKGFVSRVLFKLRRWKANEWKHKLCYKESMWSSFINGLWNHILKPSSI